MTPAARYQAAITVLDQINDGAVPEQVLTNWARQNRYAGSKDRAAVRDHVYDVLRQLRSLAALGGGTDGRQLVLGLLRKSGQAPDAVFGAGGYAPDALTPEEAAGGSAEMTAAEAADMPDWLWPMWTSDLGAEADAVARLLQHRAPITLRVNMRRTTREQAAEALASDGIETIALPDIKTALQVTENERRVAQSQAFADGWIEVQDAASQHAMLALAPHVGAHFLDFCAGGGGKALAIADLTDAAVTAHDIASQRMADILPRAERAGVKIAIASQTPSATFDSVLCDAPCSGSGTWRRTPAAKWALTQERLVELTQMQDQVLRDGAARVAPGGVLAYATCSVLRCENEERVAHFLGQNTDFVQESGENLLPTPTHDGFFLAILRRG